LSAAACAPALAIEVLDQLPHRIGNCFDALEFENSLMYPLDFVGRYDPVIEDARLVGAALFGHLLYSRCQLLAKAAIASLSVGS
jgi:hypothetical protein